MDLEKDLPLIRRSLQKGDYVLSRHFSEQLEEREIALKKIEEVIQTNMLGITFQGNDTYKVWFSHGRNKDLNIIVRILLDKSVRLVTFFPCDSERRKR